MKPGRVRPLDAAGRERAAAHFGLARRLAWAFFRKSANRASYDDLRAEALFALTYAASMFEEDRGVPFGAYAVMVIRHRLTVAAARRRSGCREYPASGFGAAEPLAVPCPRTAPVEGTAEDSELLRRVRDVLPPRWYDALVLYHLEGRTMDEVGRTLGVTRERVRQILNKAAARARGRLPDYVG